MRTYISKDKNKSKLPKVSSNKKNVHDKNITFACVLLCLVYNFSKNEDFYVNDRFFKTVNYLLKKLCLSTYSLRSINEILTDIKNVTGICFSQHYNVLKKGKQIVVRTITSKVVIPAHLEDKKNKLCTARIKKENNNNINKQKCLSKIKKSFKQKILEHFFKKDKNINLTKNDIFVILHCLMKEKPCSINIIDRLYKDLEKYHIYKKAGRPKEFYNPQILSNVEISTRYARNAGKTVMLKYKGNKSKEEIGSKIIYKELLDLYPEFQFGEIIKSEKNRGYHKNKVRKKDFYARWEKLNIKFLATKLDLIWITKYGKKVLVDKPTGKKWVEKEKIPTITEINKRREKEIVSDKTSIIIDGLLGLWC